MGFTLSTGLEADKVEVLLLELLYKTDYSNDFDRKVRVPRGPLRALGGCAVCVPVCVCVPVWLSVCVGGSGRSVPQHPRPQPARWISLQGVILCFGLCARGQAKTVLGVLHDFEERIQESEQSWQIGAWRVRHPCSIVSSLEAS